MKVQSLALMFSEEIPRSAFSQKIGDIIPSPNGTARISKITDSAVYVEMDITDPALIAKITQGGASEHL